MMSQCTFKKGNMVTVAWVDNSKIKVGSKVTLKDVDGIWTVTSISDRSLPDDYVNERSQDYKRTRKTSDI